MSAEPRLDQALSSPVRLRIAAYLAGCDQADFSTVQEFCQMSTSSLSKQVTTLLEGGYLEVHKVAAGRYTKTRLALTAAGREALVAHVAWLRQVAERATTPA